MSTEPHDPETSDRPRAADHGTQRSDDERADVQADRRTQRDLDDGELGGEA